MTLDEALESIKPTNTLGNTLEEEIQIYPAGSITLFRDTDMKQMVEDDKYAGADTPPLNERLLYADGKSGESLHLHIFSSQTGYSLSAAFGTQNKDSAKRFEEAGLRQDKDISIPNSIKSIYDYILVKEFGKEIQPVVYDKADRLFEEFVQ